MDISPAALPARSGRCTPQDEKHPLFAVYSQYRTGLAARLVDSDDFRDWLSQHEANLLHTRYTEHPRYPAFLTWMRENKGGARPCCPSACNPGGVAFPVNFEFWMIGGRW